MTDHPVSVEHAIRARYGAHIPSTAADATFRCFRIDRLNNGFVMKAEKSAIFGTIIGGEAWIWRPDRIDWIGYKHKDNKDIRFEWMIWEGARSSLERNERLSREDGERLALAVKRLEMWL